jgi:hypothetical protein
VSPDKPFLKMCGFDYDLKMREMEDGEVIAVVYVLFADCGMKFSARK